MQGVITTLQHAQLAAPEPCLLCGGVGCTHLRPHFQHLAAARHSQLGVCSSDRINHAHNCMGTVMVHCQVRGFQQAGNSVHVGSARHGYPIYAVSQPNVVQIATHRLGSRLGRSCGSARSHKTCCAPRCCPQCPPHPPPAPADSRQQGLR